MSFALIYTKTERGADEVRTRSASISPLARRVLIMIDGRRSEHELQWVVRDGELASILAELRALGLIEECGMSEVDEAQAEELEENDATVPMDATLRLDLGLGAGAAPPTLREPISSPLRSAASPAGDAITPARTSTLVIRPQPPAPAAPPAGPSLEDIKRSAVRALYERLGPYGEEPAARIQDCKSLDALREQIKHACRRISTFRGEPAAREYLATLGLR